MIRYSIVPCSVGLVLVAATPRGVCAVNLGDDAKSLAHELRSDFPGATIERAEDELKHWTTAVIRGIDDPHQQIEVPLDIAGTAFQKRVWQALRKIPAGKTASYTDIAKKIGSPSAVRAVAGACAANPVSILVPCHRVVRSDGNLSGYRWGAGRKKLLLQREGAVNPENAQPIAEARSTQKRAEVALA